MFMSSRKEIFTRAPDCWVPKNVSKETVQKASLLRVFQPGRRTQAIGRLLWARRPRKLQRAKARQGSEAGASEMKEAG